MSTSLIIALVVAACIAIAILVIRAQHRRKKLQQHQEFFQCVISPEHHVVIIQEYPLVIGTANVENNYHPWLIQTRVTYDPWLVDDTLVNATVFIAEVNSIASQEFRKLEQNTLLLEDIPLQNRGIVELKRRYDPSRRIPFPSLDDVQHLTTRQARRLWATAAELRNEFHLYETIQGHITIVLNQRIKEMASKHRDQKIQ